MRHAHELSKSERWKIAKECRREVYALYGRSGYVFAGRCGECDSLIVSETLEVEFRTLSGDAPKTVDGHYLLVYPHIVVARCPQCGLKNVMLTNFPSPEAAAHFFECLKAAERSAR